MICLLNTWQNSRHQSIFHSQKKEKQLSYYQLWIYPVYLSIFRVEILVLLQTVMNQ